MTTISFAPVADGYGFLCSVWQNVVRCRRQRRNKERQNEDWSRRRGFGFREIFGLFVFSVKIWSEEVINGLPKRCKSDRYLDALSSLKRSVKRSAHACRLVNDIVQPSMHTLETSTSRSGILPLRQWNLPSQKRRS